MLYINNNNGWDEVVVTEDLFFNDSSAIEAHYIRLKLLKSKRNRIHDKDSNNFGQFSYLAFLKLKTNKISLTATVLKRDLYPHSALISNLLRIYIRCPIRSNSTSPTKNTKIEIY